MAGLVLMAELFLMARGIRLLFIIQIKSESFVAGLFFDGQALFDWEL